MERDEFYKSIADQTPALIGIYNINTGEYLYVNKSITKILGYNPAEFIDGGIAFVTTLVHPEDVARIMEQNQQALSNANQSGGAGDNDPIANFEYRMRHKDGSWRWLHTDGSIFSRDASGNVDCVMNISIDITGRKNTEAKLAEFAEELERRVEERTREQEQLAETIRESEERYRTLLESVQDYGIYMLDPTGRVISWNKGAERIYGYPDEEVIGKHNSMFFSEADILNNLPVQELEQAREAESYEIEGIRIKKDGTKLYVHATISPVFEKDGSLRGFTKVVRDITERKIAEDTIRHQALHDPLTGLPNRKALEERLELALQMALREKTKIGLMFLDLDRFKNINDSLGHLVGDVLLKEVGSRFTASVRGEDTVARLGGDEFIIMIPHITNSADMVKLAEKILQAIAQPITVGQHTLHMTTSIGITISPADGDTIHSLLKNADTALYRAKESRRNRYQFYNQTMNVRASERFKLENDFREALKKDEFELFYQPIINVKSKRTTGAEALLRWHHPKLGMIYPNEFISIAEEIGMIAQLGNWVTRQACLQQKKWAAAGLKNMQIAVNVSARQFSEPNFVSDMAKIIEETGIDTHYLELEITEGIAMENIDRTSDKLNQLKRMGIQITIDDFGTGYSSLYYLKRFPIHNLKIDKSFVRHAITNSNDSTIIRTIISMAHNLNLQVIAEGVETDQQLQFLSILRCNRAQGYLIARPMANPNFEQWLLARA